MTYQQQADALFEDQKQTWPTLGTNWAMLDAARLRSFDFGGFRIRVQFNPKRIVSSAAKVDRVSIENRSCFLCEENRPPEEKSVSFGEEYEILCNPFPIFREHFTIAHRRHIPQVIEGVFTEFLRLSRELPELVVFYNAPNCGASAPDHLHFQAGSLGFMPIEEQMDLLLDRYGQRVPVRGVSLTAVDDGLRRFLVMESVQPDRLEELFRSIFGFLKRRNGKGEAGEEEPLLNMLAYYRGRWQILVFPRQKHRPWQFFEEGDKNILLSPAAVDMGGILITPLEKDFLKITPEDIKDIFSQICLSEGGLQELVQHISGM
jgi:ATP adenylyltransferase/5',5'''-P-1,P-4-tetraphosphate phosphorylase II